MKKTQGKYLLKTIRKNSVSFFAVALIAAAGIAIFLGIRSGASAILIRSDRYFAENHLASLEIAGANGITQEDVELLAKQPGVDVAEGGYRTMVIMDGEHEKFTLQVRSLLDELNRPVVLEGTLPHAGDEAAVEQIFATEQNIRIGDEIKIEHNGELIHDTFRVTAIINEPSFSCSTIQDARGKSEAGLGSADYYIELARDAFDASYYDNCYTTVYIKNNVLSEIYFYAEEYAAQEAALKEELEVFGRERAMLRHESLMQRAEEKIADAEKELKDAERKINEGEKELADGREELAEQEEELAEALTEIEEALRGFGLGKDLEEAGKQLEGLGPAGAALNAAIADYQEGREAIADAGKELDGAEQELADAKTELADAGLELDRAKEEVADIQQKDWIFSGRNSMGDVRGIETGVDGLFTLSYSLALVFLLVAVVVCYAAIVRMIDDQRTLIGAQKALGFRTKEIFGHFLRYNMLCAALGVLLGCVLAVVIVESVILHNMNVWGKLRWQPQL